MMSLLNYILVKWKFPETRVLSVEPSSYRIFEGIYNLKRAFNMHGLRVFFIASFLFSFGWSFFFEFVPVLLREKFDYTASHIGNFYAYAGMIYSLSAGVLTLPILNRYAPEKIVSKALIVAGLYLPLFFFISESLHMWFYLPPLLYLVALVFPTSGALVSNRTDPDRQGEVMGIYHSVGAFAIGVSPLFAGSLVAEYPSMTVVIGGACLFSAGTLFWLKNSLSHQEKAYA